MRGSHRWLGAIALFAIFFNGSAMADGCIDNEAAHKKAAEALRKNPPPLGMPEIDGLTLDAYRSSGDPRCSGPQERRSNYYFNTKASLLEFYTAVFPYIKSADFWTSPTGANSHDFFLTSTARVRVICKNQNGVHGSCVDKPIDQLGVIHQIEVQRRPVEGLKPLTSDGPGYNWTPRDLAESRGIPAAGKAWTYAGTSQTNKTQSNKPADTTAPSQTASAQSSAGSTTAESTGKCSNGSAAGKAASQVAKSVLGGLLGGKKPQVESLPMPSGDCKQ